MPSFKSSQRLRRAKRFRMHIRKLGSDRLTVFRSSRHIYAQIFNADGSKVLACASSLEKDLRAMKIGNNIKLATVVGELIATRAKKVGIEKVAFDRGGFKYHGRIKALADAARGQGLSF